MTTISINAFGIGLERFNYENGEPLFMVSKFRHFLKTEDINDVEEDEESVEDSITWRDLLLEFGLDDMITAAIERYGDEHPAIKYITNFNAMDDEYLVYQIRPQWLLTEEEKSFTEEDIKEAIYLILFPYINWYKDFIFNEMEYITIIDEI